MTEIGDYLRLLFARAASCTACGAASRCAAREPRTWSPRSPRCPPGTRLTVAFPSRPEPGEARAWAAELVEEGFVRAASRRQRGSPRRGAVAAAQETSRSWVLVDRLQAGKRRAGAAGRFGGDRLSARRGPAGPVDRSRRAALRPPPALPALRPGAGPPQPRLFDLNDPLGPACPRGAGTGTGCRLPGRRGPERNPAPATCRGGEAARNERPARTAWRRRAPLRRHCLGERHQRRTTSGGVDRLCRKRVLASCRQRPESSRCIEQIRRRLALLPEVELGYLTLSVDAATHSATGTSSGCACAPRLGANLVGALYVLDEPRRACTRRCWQS